MVTGETSVLLTVALTAFGLCGPAQHLALRRAIMIKYCTRSRYFSNYHYYLVTVA